MHAASDGWSERDRTGRDGLRRRSSAKGRSGHASTRDVKAMWRNELTGNERMADGVSLTVRGWVCCCRGAEYCSPGAGVLGTGRGGGGAGALGARLEAAGMTALELMLMPASLARLPKTEDAVPESRLGPATLVSDDGDRQIGMRRGLK